LCGLLTRFNDGKARDEFRALLEEWIFRMVSSHVVRRFNEGVARDLEEYGHDT
jgi:hypothetical protein